jgi:hypothetical protein
MPRLKPVMRRLQEINYESQRRSSFLDILRYTTSNSAVCRGGAGMGRGHNDIWNLNYEYDQINN